MDTRNRVSYVPGALVWVHRFVQHSQHLQGSSGKEIDWSSSKTDWIKWIQSEWEIEDFLKMIKSVPVVIVLSDVLIDTVTQHNKLQDCSVCLPYSQTLVWQGLWLFLWVTQSNESPKLSDEFRLESYSRYWTRIPDIYCELHDCEPRLVANCFGWVVMMMDCTWLVH